MKHTPGPWIVNTATPTTVEQPSGGTIAVTYQSVPNYRRLPTKEQAYANARLIAAAPDMLEALELVMETYCLYIDFTRETEQMRKARTLVGYAIDKAKGEKP